MAHSERTFRKVSLKSGLGDLLKRSYCKIFQILAELESSWDPALLIRLILNLSSLPNQTF